MLFFIIFFLLKCATGTTPLRETIEINEDAYEKAVVVIGIEEKIGSPKSLNKFCIRSWIFRENGNLMHQIYAYYGYTGKEWRFYEKAYSQEGKPLQLVKIQRDADYYESINVYNEEIGVTIADKYLRNHLDGFKVKISALNDDSFMIYVSAEQIKSQLNKIQEYKKLHNL
jgi:hypothetical protein